MVVSVVPDGPSWVTCYSCGYNKRLDAALRDYAQDRMSKAIHDLANWVVDNDGCIAPGIKAPKSSTPKGERIRDYGADVQPLIGVPFPETATKFMAKKGVSAEVARQLFVWNPVKRIIVFPVLAWRNSKLTVIGGGARKPAPKKTGKLKYWTEYPYDASRHLYGEHLLPQWRGKDILVVEGYFDAAHCWALGIPCVAVMGKSFNTTRAKLLADHGIRRAVVVLDPDFYEGPNWKKIMRQTAAYLTAVEVIPDCRIPKEDPKYSDRGVLESYLQEEI